MAGAPQQGLGTMDLTGIPGELPEPQAFAALLAEYDRALDAAQRALGALNSKVAILSEEIEHKNRLLARQERLAALGEMAAGVAHEIRNPLGGISLYLEMLSNDVKGNPPAAALCGKISNAVGRLNHTVEAILGFTRQLDPQVSRVESRWLVEEALGLAKPVLDSGALTTRVDIDHAVPSFDADPQLLHQLLLNLIRNAAEASPKGSSVEIGIRAVVGRDSERRRVADVNVNTGSGGALIVGDGGHGFVEISVRDYGAGIEDGVKGKLFTPFASTKKGGTGLGLAFCQRIAEAHRGTISGDNHEHGGAVFRVMLPRNS